MSNFTVRDPRTIVIVAIVVITMLGTIIVGITGTVDSLPFVAMFVATIAVALGLGPRDPGARA